MGDNASDGGSDVPPIIEVAGTHQGSLVLWRHGSDLMGFKTKTIHMRNDGSGRREHEKGYVVVPLPAVLPLTNSSCGQDTLCSLEASPTINSGF